MLQGAQCVYCAPMLARYYLRRLDGIDNLWLEHRTRVSREQVCVYPQRGSCAQALLDLLVTVDGASKGQHEERDEHHLEGGLIGGITCVEGPTGEQHLLDVGGEDCADGEEGSEHLPRGEQQLARSEEEEVEDGSDPELGGHLRVSLVSQDSVHRNRWRSVH